MMTRYAVGGRIQDFSRTENDGPIICKACSRLIVSRVNLKHGNICPFCNREVNVALKNDILGDDVLSQYDDDNEDPPVAIEC